MPSLRRRHSRHSTVAQTRGDKAHSRHPTRVRLGISAGFRYTFFTGGYFGLPLSRNHLDTPSRRNNIRNSLNRLAYKKVNGSYFYSIAIYPMLRLISWNLATQCLIVTGGGNVSECGRLSQPSRLLGAL